MCRHRHQWMRRVASRFRGRIEVVKSNVGILSLIQSDRILRSWLHCNVPQSNVVSRRLKIADCEVRFSCEHLEAGNASDRRQQGIEDLAVRRERHGRGCAAEGDGAADRRRVRSDRDEGVCRNGGGAGADTRHDPAGVRIVDDMVCAQLENRVDTQRQNGRCTAAWRWIRNRNGGPA